MEIKSLQPEIEKLQKSSETLTKFMEGKYLKPPVHAGSYRLGGPAPYAVSFSVAVKPSWLKRACMRTFLGFEWVDVIDTTDL